MLFFYHWNPKFKLLRKRLALQIWVRNELRFFLPRNPGSHTLRVQSCRATIVQVLSFCLHESIPVTHHALSIEVQPSSAETPRDHTLQEEIAFISHWPCFLHLLLSHKDNIYSICHSNFVMTN